MLYLMLAAEIFLTKRMMNIRRSQVCANNIVDPRHFRQAQAVLAGNRVGQDRRIKLYFAQLKENHQTLEIYPQRGFIFRLVLCLFIDENLFEVRVIFNNILTDFID